MLTLRQSKVTQRAPTRNGLCRSRTWDCYLGNRESPRHKCACRTQNWRSMLPDTSLPPPRTPPASLAQSTSGFQLIPRRAARFSARRLQQDEQASRTAKVMECETYMLRP
jgi:hypothetical protein